MEQLNRTAPAPVAAGNEGQSIQESGQGDYNTAGQKLTIKPRLTVISSTKPQRLTKHYSLQADKLQKAGGGNMATGHADVVEVDGLQGLADLLASLKPNQALCYGVPERDSVDVVTRDAWQKMGKPDSAIPRIKEAFFWPSDYAVMMLDYDPAQNTQPLDRDGLLAALREAVPGLGRVACLWFPSSSSHIINDDTGADLTGLKGQRLYFTVRRGGDIERAGKDLQTYLWAAGHGYIMVSTAGSKLKRTTFDNSVWQTNRLDFAAGASCAALLSQKRGKPVLIEGEFEVLDTMEVIPPPDEATRTKAQANIQAEMQEADEEAQLVRHGYIEQMAYRIVGENGDDEERLEQAKRLVERALSHQTLAGDFPITVVMPSGQQFDTTVGAILDDRETYHGLTTLDPIEPGYDGGRPVGKLYLMSATPGINSFAHGGRYYKLTRPPEMVELVRGKTFEAMEQVLRLMRQSPASFDFGGPLVLVEHGQVHPLDKHGLLHWLGGMTQFWKWSGAEGKQYPVLEDPPVKIADQLLALGNRRHLKRLEAVITAPTVRPDGSLLTRPGFDELTGLLLDVNEDDLYPVPLNPTTAEVEAALERLMRPFADFPLVDMLDRSVLLASLLTAVVRPVVPTAPAFGFDAPVQGSGKTLLAKCVAALASGHNAKVQPHCREEEEIRKRLMTILLESPRCVVWDNIIGVFDSASLAGLLTSSTYTDRILGVSKSAEVPNRAIWLLTGNNLTLAGDMPRRVLKCRIDPETERPFARQFDLDPEDYTLKNRQRMAADALTIIRGWFAAGCPRADGSMASFEQWDTLVRQPVAWIANHVMPFGEYDDVMRAVDDAQAQDPEQEMWGELLEVWRAIFGDKAVTCRDVLEQYNSAYRCGEQSNQQRLLEALDEYKPGRTLSARSLGKVLQFRADRLVNGMRLRKIQTGGKHAQLWQVEVIE
ncbi:hypothetical protein Q673_01555 [Marinobacter sp. EN3]|uniref:hypothetical protein n=1 Tax=Marinobacter sp. EN3 TaxID=1397533 RepID=UPI0003B87A29|nr:hypothetical protein [Marinobacter sp. EN3]ERS12326.1 hypothetical protein Q673_01555 [Marinobacter sp. EN3]